MKPKLTLLGHEKYMDDNRDEFPSNSPHPYLLLLIWFGNIIIREGADYKFF